MPGLHVMIVQESFISSCHLGPGSPVAPCSLRRPVSSWLKVEVLGRHAPARLLLCKIRRGQQMEKGWDSERGNSLTLETRAQKYWVPVPATLHSAQLQMDVAGTRQVRSCGVIAEYLTVISISSSQEQQLFEGLSGVSILQRKSPRPGLVVTCPGLWEISVFGWPSHLIGKL